MTDASVPDASPEIYRAVARALRDQSLSPDDWAEIAAFVRREASDLLAAGRTSYLVLGSYRSPYQRRLRIVQHELSRPVDAHAVVLGDMETPDTDEAVTFRVKFHVAAGAADWLVGVYEKESGGESPELGKLSELFPGETYVLPRDYRVQLSNVTSRADVLAAATVIYLGDESTEAKAALLRKLLDRARELDVPITEGELVEFLAEREADGYDLPGYSWVHESEFEFFENRGRCFPWTTEDGLRERTGTVSRETR